MITLSRWMLAGALLASPAAGAASQARLPAAPVLQESTSGRDNFRAYCASCHGRSGRGDGPLAPELLTPPADLTALSQRSGGAFPRAQVRSYVEGTGRPVPSHGPTSMPVWGSIFRAFDPYDSRVNQRIDNLVTYIESLQRPRR